MQSTRYFWGRDENTKLNNFQEMAQKILTEITDERSRTIWEKWQKKYGGNNSGI